MYIFQYLSVVKVAGTPDDQEMSPQWWSQLHQGRFTNKNWPGLTDQPSLKWVPGETSWESVDSLRNTDHISHRMLIGL